MRRIFVTLFTLGLLTTGIPMMQTAYAGSFDYDVSVQNNAISFAPSQFFAGDQVRVYGTVINTGNKDISGYVAFYQGTTMIGEPQPFSSRVNGAAEDFWVDWTPFAGTYNVAMKLIKADPTDQNPLNNENVSGIMTITERPAPPAQVAPPPPSPAPAPTTATPSTNPSSNPTPAPSQQTTPARLATTPAKSTTSPTTTPANAQQASGMPSLETLQLPTTPTADVAPNPTPDSSTATTESQPPSVIAQDTGAAPKQGSLTGVWLFVGGVFALLLLLVGIWFYKKGRELNDESDKW